MKNIKNIIYVMLKLNSIIVFRSVHIESYNIYYKIYKCEETNINDYHKSIL